MVKLRAERRRMCRARECWRYGMESKITIDARMVGPSGIGTYLKNLLDQFAVLDHGFCFRVISSHPDDLPRLPLERFQIVGTNAPIYSLAEQLEIARLAHGTDLLYVPHYNIPYFYRGKLVVTIHDLTHITFRQFFPGFAAHHYARFMLGAAVRRAQTIITVSQFSRRSIQEHFRVKDEKIQVIYPPPAARILQTGFTPVPPADFGISGDYILYAGALKKHKNVEALVRAYALLPKGHRDRFQLVLAGKEDDSAPAVRQRIKELKLDHRVVITGVVSGDELHALYAGATVFAMVSLNEGFGLPALEAMAHGVPVVVSNTSSLPEVVGEAGILVDPLSDRSIADDLQRLLDNPALRLELGELGRQRAQTFSARDFALRHLEVYREALRA